MKFLEFMKKQILTFFFTIFLLIVGYAQEKPIEKIKSVRIIYQVENHFHQISWKKFKIEFIKMNR